MAVTDDSGGDGQSGGGHTPDDILEVFDGPFFQEIANRKRKGRDAKILLTAKDGQTGIGKSNLSDFLGYVLDTSKNGFNEDKVTIDPHEFLDMYSILPRGSATIMEEGEQFDARRASSHKNVDASEKWQMARVREIVAIVNLPSPEEIDSRFERLADYWINVERRGRARIYKKRIHPIKRKVYYETLQTLEWPNMDKSPTFQKMRKLKDDRLDAGDHDSNWVRMSEVQDKIERAVKDAKQEERDKWLTAIYEETELTGADVANLSVCDVKASRISQIANEY